MRNSERGLATGTIVYGIYVIESVLGEGGFGVTYLASRKDTGQTVALKEYYPLAYGRRTESCKLEPVPGKETDYERGRERFVREASVLREFCYLEGIVKVWDCFEANGTAYIIMDYIDGITLKEYVSCHGGMGYDEWMDMLSPILRSLITLHKHGVIHRDISPDNLMIGMDNQLYLIDFGAAKEIEYGKTTTVLLKVGYLHDGEMGAWTDVYAICATIYTALCGKAPADAVARLQGKPLIPLEDQGVTLEPWQWNAIQKGMRIRAAERYQNVEELYEALTVAPGDVELPTIMDVATDDKMQEQMHRVSDRGGRHVVLRRVGIMAAFTVLVCMAAIWGIQGRNQVEAQPETATTADTATEQISEELSTEQVKICTMPDVVGMSEIEAREKIIREDSKIQITIEREYSSQMDKDLVMEQNVAADTKYNEGAITQIVLTVSDGVEATTAAPSKPASTQDTQKYDVKSNKKQTEDFYLDD